MLISGILAALPILPAEALKVSGTDTVYVTASGKKYHKQDCRYAKNATPTTRAEADAKGLTPCKVCKAGE